MAKRDSVILRRRRVIVFSFEGKANKTESLYFDHFCASNNQYILKQFSSGANDPEKIIRETKAKRTDFDYNASEDLTFIFLDGDCDKDKIAKIEQLSQKLPKDIKIILSNPCFEVWYLNHFEKYGRILNSQQVINELRKYIPSYIKTYDAYPKLNELRNEAIKNTQFQNKLDNEHCSTGVFELFTKNLIKDCE